MRITAIAAITCLSVVWANAEEIRLNCTNSLGPPNDIITVDTTARAITYNGHQTRDPLITNNFFVTTFVAKTGNVYKIQISRLDGSIRIDGNVNGQSISNSGSCTRVKENAF